MDEWATECAAKNDTRVVPVYFDVTDAAAVKNALMTIFKWEQRIWHKPYEYQGKTIMVWGM